jgi:2-amino-4-hydroxy-6-hydroxymethyldihydropteridine diphosphokinase
VKTLAAIGFGANLGSTVAQIHAARQGVATLSDTAEIAFSPLYQTAPHEAAGPDYINAVQLIETTLSADALLTYLQQIEITQGRERSFRNAPRTLDLDLLLFGNQVSRSDCLTVPHPRMHARAFVLVPLLDVWPDAIIPGRGSARDLLAHLPPQSIHVL